MLEKFHVPETELEKADFQGNAMDAWLRNLHITPQGNMGVGVFEGRSGHFVFEYGHDEAVYVIEGSYCLEDLDSGRTIIVEQGDVAFIPKGTRLRATIVEPLRCVYVTSPAWTG